MRRFLLFVALFTSINSFAQYVATENQLIADIENANNTTAKVQALGSLADFYYIYRAEKKGDSTLQKQFSLADQSEDKTLVLEALFGNAINNISSWTSTNSYDRALAFVQKGLDYARSQKRDDLESLAYLRKASIFRKRGQHDEALDQITKAFSTIGNRKMDSLRTTLYLEMGNIFLAKGDAVGAYKNFNNAYDLAYTNKNIPLQSSAYHHYAKLYHSLGSIEIALNNVQKSLSLNKKAGYQHGLLEDYYTLARLTDEKDYFSKTLSLAETLKSERYKLNAKRIILAYLTVVQKNSDSALAYLNANEDLKQSYLNVGLANYYITLAGIYQYAGKHDSALYYYSSAEPQMQGSFDKPILQSFYQEQALSYMFLGDQKKATEYYEKAYSMAQSVRDINTMTVLTATLSELFAKSNNYQRGYEYNQLHIRLKDTLGKMSSQREVVLLEVERENNRHLKDLAEMDAQTLRTRNLQYMGISIAILSVFMIMILIGMFPVSKMIIKMVGFFSFICLFEFIVLLIDSYLHKLAHGEPLKIWLTKIFIIALLVPLQHYMEHTVVRFLASQRLLQMRKQLSIKRIWASIKTPASEEAGVEENAVV